MAGADFEVVFAELRERMIRAAEGHIVVTDAPGALVLHAPIANPLKPKERMWFGAVQVKKAYVSYHLMPVYTHASMRDRISPALARRMQGKSCFNFKSADPVLFDELEALTAEGARLYREPFEVRRGAC